MITKFKIFESKKIVIDEYSFTINDIQEYYNEINLYFQPRTNRFIQKYLIHNIVSIQSKKENGEYYDKIIPNNIVYNPSYIDQFTIYYTNKNKKSAEYKLSDNDVITLYNISGSLRKIIERIELKKDAKKYNL